MKKLIYEGLGVREPPPKVLKRFEQLAAALARQGYTLRYLADDAGAAFVRGCDQAGGSKELLLPEASPASFVLCWTPQAEESDTAVSPEADNLAQWLERAKQAEVPVFQLERAGAYDQFVAHVLADCRPFHKDGTLPSHGEVLVFGSNLAGRHGAGSAKVARENFGAVYGCGRGHQGQSYAIPTKDGRPGTPNLKDPAATLPLDFIREEVNGFIEYAKAHPDQKFFVVRLGCVLAAHTDADIAPLFARAPSNCSFPDVWRPWLGPRKGVPEPATASTRVPPVDLGPALNLFSGSQGLGGALTNMSERARQKGCIQQSYPVTYGGVTYPDSEAAYQTLKRPGDEAYNDYLMIDVIALKFLQNRKLLDQVTARGGVWWLATCSHFTHAKSASFQSWEGQGVKSRFIRNLMLGYQQAMSALAVLERSYPPTTVVHVKQAPFDTYIGRVNGKLPASEWQNQFHLGEDGTRPEVVDKYVRLTLGFRPDLLAGIDSLRGKSLGCWCKDKHNPELCHGDPLAALADGRPLLPVLRPQPLQAGLFDEPA